MKSQKTHSWFTFVELAVVVVILVVLWAIALLSVNNCSSVARNSARLTDTNNMKNALELYAMQNLHYPLPDDSKSIILWWSVAWRQWTFWNEVKKQVWNFDKLPKDPLTKELFEYSRAEKLDEFEIKYILEDNDHKYAYNPMLNTTFAANKIRKDYKTTWNFNWIFIKSWRKFFAVPSIIADNITSNKKLDDNEKIRIANNWVFKDFTLVKLSDNTPKTQEEKINFAKKIKTAYSVTNTNIKSNNKNLNNIKSDSTDESLYSDVNKILWWKNKRYQAQED
jgi:type II secretory pathway pseudopilin PulG